MKLTRMKTNRITSPLGFELRSLSFSWTVEDTDAKNQVWARVQVSRDPAFQQILWLLHSKIYENKTRILTILSIKSSFYSGLLRFLLNDDMV